LPTVDRSRKPRTCRSDRRTPLFAAGCAGSARERTSSVDTHDAPAQTPSLDILRARDLVPYQQLAGSGVGVMGIQIAKLRGARVIATASTEEKRAKARELGADETVDYTQGDWAREVRQLTGKRGVDVVFEHTGAATWESSIQALKTDGRLVTCGATSGFAAQTDIRQLFYRHLTFLGSFMGAKWELLDAMPFVEAGRIRPVVDRTLPLAQAREAHELMMQREQFGKLVLMP